MSNNESSPGGAAFLYRKEIVDVACINIERKVFLMTCRQELGEYKKDEAIRHFM